MQERMRHIVQKTPVKGDYNPKSHVPVNSKVSVNAPQTGISPNNNSVLNKPVSGVNPVTPNAPVKQGTFYRHNDIKTSIAPYEAYPVPYRAQDMDAFKVSSPQSVDFLYAAKGGPASVDFLSRAGTSNVVANAVVGYKGHGVYSPTPLLPANTPLIPLSATIGSTCSTQQMITSNTSIPIDVASPISLDTSLISTNTAISKDVSPNDMVAIPPLDIVLDSPHSLSSLPPSPIRPSFVTDQVFRELCNAATACQLVHLGASREDTYLLHSLFRGYPGENITSMQKVASHVKPFKGSLSLRDKLTNNILNSFHPSWVDELKHVSPKKGSMLVFELLGLYKFNRCQQDQLSFTHEKVPQGAFYYNNSGNRNPDYSLQLSTPVGEITTMGLDFKFIKGFKKNADIVKGCSSEFEIQIMKAHTEFEAAIKTILNANTLSDADVILANMLIADLKTNIKAYSLVQDINNFSSSYNVLGEVYNDFLVRNRIGMNRIVIISEQDFLLNPEIKEAFSACFKHFYTSNDSILFQFLQDYNSKNPNEILDSKQIISDFAKFFFEQSSF